MSADAQHLFRAICSDHYVNLKVALKLELSRDRQSVMDLFDRVRRLHPGMDQFKRYQDEIALETNTSGQEHLWLAIRANSIRSGSVNPDSLEDGYRYHKSILELTPPFLTISPLDIDFVELLYGFDMPAPGNHNEIIYDALYAGSHLSPLMDIPGTSPIDVQPVFGVLIRDESETEAQFEVKTRATRGSDDGSHPDPISVYLTLRRRGPFRDLSGVGPAFDSLARHGEQLLAERAEPYLLTPIYEAIRSL